MKPETLCHAVGRYCRSAKAFQKDAGPENREDARRHYVLAKYALELMERERRAAAEKERR